MFLTLQPSDQKLRFYKRVDGYATTLATSTTALSLTSDTWYTMNEGGGTA